MSGFPLAATFPSRWTILQAAFTGSQAFGYILVASSLAVLLGYLRLLKDAFWQERAAKADGRRPAPAALAVMALLLMASIALCLYPQGLLSPLVQLVERLGLLCL